MQVIPQVKNDPLYQLLKNGKVKDFNQRKAAGEVPDLAHGDLRGLDLRGLDADGLNLEGCYLHTADLRGIDFRQTNLRGASVNGARIAGAYFPVALSADEINLSLMHGTCLRYQE